MVTTIERDVIVERLSYYLIKELRPIIPSRLLEEDKEVLEKLKMKGITLKLAISEVVKASHGIFLSKRGRNGGIYLGEETLKKIKENSIPKLEKDSINKDTIIEFTEPTKPTEPTEPTEIPPPAPSVVEVSAMVKIPRISPECINEITITEKRPTRQELVNKYCILPEKEKLIEQLEKKHGIREMPMSVGKNKFLINLRSSEENIDVKLMKILHHVFHAKDCENDQISNVKIGSKEFIMDPNYEDVFSRLLIFYFEIPQLF